MSFTMGNEGQQAQDTHSPPKTLRFTELILTVDIKELQLMSE